MKLLELTVALKVSEDDLADALDALKIEIADEFTEDEVNRLKAYFTPKAVLNGSTESQAVNTSELKTEEINPQPADQNDNREPFDLDALKNLPDEQRLALMAKLSLEIPTKNAGQMAVNLQEVYWDNAEAEVVSRIAEVNSRRGKQFFEKIAIATISSIPQQIKTPQIGAFTAPKFTGREAHQIPGTQELLALAPASVQEMFQSEQSI